MDSPNIVAQQYFANSTGLQIKMIIIIGAEILCVSWGAAGTNRKKHKDATCV